MGCFLSWRRRDISSFSDMGEILGSEEIPEMEKGGEMVKRGPGRVFSPTRTQLKQSPGGWNGNVDMGISERLKKDTSRGSRVNCSKEESGMGSGSEREEEVEEEEEELKPTSSKRFKLQSKSFNCSNAVIKLTVPRRLRSAMNKRSRDSISPPLHLMSNGMGSSQMNGRKKSKQNMKRRNRGRSPQADLVPITKDEEEVIETLFCLAGMLPNTGKVEEQSSEENPSLLQEKTKAKITVLALEAPREKKILPQAIIPSSSLDGSTWEANKVIPLAESAVMDQSPMPGDNKLDLGMCSSVAPTDVGRTSQPSTSAHSDNVSSTDATEFDASFEASHGTRSLNLTNHDGSLQEQKTVNVPWKAANIPNKEEQLVKEKEKSTLPPCIEDKDPCLWPDMSTIPSYGGEVHGTTSTWPLLTKIPAWLDRPASVTGPGSSIGSALTEKVQPLMVERRQSWKKSITHVYISRLIQEYQTAERRPGWPVPPSQLNLNEEVKLDVARTEDLSEPRSVPKGVVSASVVNVPARHGIVGCPSGSALGKNWNGPDLHGIVDCPRENAVQIESVQGKKLQQDHLSSTSSGIYSSDKQNQNFLSLSSRGVGILGSVPTITSSSSSKNNNQRSDGVLGSFQTTTTSSNNHQRGGSNSSAQTHSPFLHPNFQHHSLLPYPLHHMQYPSSQLNAPQYMGSPIYYSPHHPSHVGSQKHHQIWLAQQQLSAAQYRPGGGISGSHFPKWQNGRYEPASLVPCSASSSSPMDVVDTKSLHSSQQIFSLSSLSSSRSNREHNSSFLGSCTVGSSGSGYRSEDSPQVHLV